MLTVLDDAEMWQLHAAVYQDDIRLILAEMFVGEFDYSQSAPNATMQKVLQSCRPIEVHDDSRMMVVRFQQAIAWQIVDESYTS